MSTCFLCDFLSALQYIIFLTWFNKIVISDIFRRGNDKAKNPVCIKVICQSVITPNGQQTTTNTHTHIRLCWFHCPIVKNGRHTHDLSLAFILRCIINLSNFINYFSFEIFIFYKRWLQREKERKREKRLWYK